MTGPRSGAEVYAEQVATAQDAVAEGARLNAQQQADATGWVNAGMPANMHVTRPDPRQG